MFLLLVFFFLTVNVKNEAGEVTEQCKFQLNGEETNCLAHGAGCSRVDEPALKRHRG